MKYFILFFLIPLQLVACCGCVFKSIAHKIEHLTDAIEERRNVDFSKISDLELQYYLRGQRDAYCECIEDIDKFLSINHH